MMKHWDRQHQSILIFLLLSFGLFGFFLWRGHQAHRAELKQKLPAVAAESAPMQQLQKFRLTGFDQKGKTFWNLEGDAAKIDPSQTIFMDSNVVFRLQDNTVVRTDHVQWMQAQGLLLTQAPVVVEHESAYVTGVGALGKPNESFIQLNQNIVMKIEPSTLVQCRGPLKIYYGQNKMIFHRQVKVQDAHGELRADRMQVTFGAEDKRIQEILATGHVQIRRGTDTTNSERAIYTPSTGSIRLEGNPEIVVTQTESGFSGPHGAFRN